MTKQQNKQVTDYILSAICNDGYNDELLETPEEKLQFLFDCFMSEYGWNIEKNGFDGALKEWLSGLPSSINIAFNYCDIITLTKEWGTLPEQATNRQEYGITSNYFNFMACKIIGLFHRYNIGV